MKQSQLNINIYGRRNTLFPGITKYIPLALLLFISLCTYAQTQTIITGVVRDAEYRAAIPGAIVSEGLSESQTTTDATGAFQLSVPTNATLNLTIAHKGFETYSMPVFASKRIVDIGVIELQHIDLNILEIFRLSDRAPLKYPVTRSNLGTSDLASEKGMMQLPFSIQNIAGIYTSSRGSQFGESRINIRGFGQQHLSVLVNGVPLNYTDTWNFNWAGRNGIQEMLSSIQIQKGTSTNLHYSPFGAGALNMVKMSASQRAGGNVGFEYGAGDYMRSTVAIHSGLLNEKFAISMKGVRETSTGIINGTWSDSWAYFLALTYAPSEKHRLEAYAMGAPQRHGQANNMQHIAAYSHRTARDLGVPDEVLEAIPQSSAGRYYNQGINAVDPDYSGQQYWNGQPHDRYASSFLNENEHYSHAPVAQINWYAEWSRKISQYTMIYYTGLAEGNTGVSGDVNLDYTGPSPFIDYNSTIAENMVKTASEGILSNTVRNLSSLGAMSRVNFHFTDQFKSSLGFNVSSTNIIRYQEVRDLLGGSYFIFAGNQFDGQSAYEKQLGDIIGYHHSSNLARVDFYGNLEYSGKKLSTFLTGAYSLGDHNFTNHLKRDPANPQRVSTLAPVVSPGYQIKSGISYLLTDPLLIYANYSYISREPDNRLAISLLEQSVTELPKDMVFRGFDAGLRLSFSPTARVAINYYDYWMVNGTMMQQYTDLLSNEYILYIFNIDQHHRGVEFEAGVRPLRFFEIEGNASLGNWVYADDAMGILSELSSPGEETRYTFNNKNLAAGNAPRLQLGTTLSIHPLLNAYVQASFRFFGSHFAAWNPAGNLTRSTEQLWEIPEYYLLDLHAGYTIVTNSRFRIALHGHVFNLLDELYIQDALNNGALKYLPGEPEEYINSAAAATVFTGLPRTYSFGMKLSF